MEEGLKLIQFMVFKIRWQFCQNFPGGYIFVKKSNNRGCNKHENIQVEFRIRRPTVELEGNNN